MTTSILISTYNSPLYLNLCLKAVLRQTVMPDEILIADDGSTEETKKLIDSFRSLTSVPIKHIWHEDRGFRLGQIRNKAIKECTSEYIIQIDGDIVIDSNFVSDHLKYVQKGTYLSGSRTMVTEKRSKEVLEAGEFCPFFFSQGIRHRLNAIRIPFLTPYFHGNKRLNGCNMSYWKSDIFAINGYDEDISGWGCEDNDVAERLSRNGIQKKHLKFSAIQYHLWHKSNNRDALSAHKELLQKNKESGIVRCKNGLSKEE